MKINQKIYFFLICVVYILFSYSLCSTHELRHPNSIFNTKRNRFCATPFYLMLFILFIYFIYFIF